MDQRVILYGMSWKDYEIMLAIRGDRAGVRIGRARAEGREVRRGGVR